LRHNHLGHEKQRITEDPLQDNLSEILLK
jgi:hypothetical protein